MTLGARVPGATAVGMTHLGCPAINIDGGVHVVVSLQLCSMGRLETADYGEAGVPRD